MGYSCKRGPVEPTLELRIPYAGTELEVGWIGFVGDVGDVGEVGEVEGAYRLRGRKARGSSPLGEKYLLRRTGRGRRGLRLPVCTYIRSEWG